MAKSLDLVGKRFGHLTVVSRAENNHRGNTQWNCVCDCGGKKVVLGYDLKKGRTTTCGCKAYLVGKPSHSRISLVGNRYGKLTVVSLNEERSKNGVLVWNCKCDCGNSFIARGGNLKSGKATHCGCLKPEFPNNFIDITGNRYGRLVAVEIASRGHGAVMWRCICDCGNEKIVPAENLRNGHTRSCGCLLKESRRKNALSNALINRDLPTDPETYRLIKTAFNSMHGRCSTSYHKPENYHDRGIAVCDEWTTFEPFLEWALENGFEQGLTLDRIDVNGGYNPDNCRWTTQKVQSNNKRTNVYITIDGETKTMRQWADHFGVSYPMVKARKRYGWPQSRWFDPPQK